MNNLITFEDYKIEARRKLNKGTWTFISSGDYKEYTAKDNIAAFNRYLIRPCVLRDVSSVDVSTTVLGSKISFPVGVSPSAFHCLAHSDGEKATARACQRINTCMIPSSWSSVSLEDISTAGGDGLRWMHIAFMNETETTFNLVKRAEKAGYQALVVTLDTPVRYRKKPDIRVNFSFPPGILPQNFHSNGSLPSDSEQAVSSFISAKATWKSLDWLHSITTLPIILKGILRPDDAREALKHNIQGILVSNHGGRKLDTVPATIDALPGIVHAIKGSGVEVYIDGGIRHGTDVLKAIALGARAVFIGRPVLYGLACNGEEGVYQVLNILKEEVRQAFTLSGCRNIDEVQSTKDLVVHKTQYYDIIKSRL